MFSFLTVRFRADGPSGPSSAQRDKREAVGRSRGGFGSKACVIADASGRAIGFALAPGQAHELPMVPLLLGSTGAGLAGGFRGSAGVPGLNPPA